MKVTTIAALLVALLCSGCSSEDPPAPPRLPVGPCTGGPASAAIPPRPVSTELNIRWLPECVGRHAPLFAKAAKTHQVDAELLAILTLVESGGFTRATSRSGARGLMQIMPATGRIIADQRKLRGHETALLYAPARNIDYGAYYIAEQLTRFQNANFDTAVEHAAAAYNGGPTLLTRHLEGAAELPAQTQRYKYWVRGMWDQRRDAQSPRLDEWRAAGGERLLVLSRKEMQKGEATQDRKKKQGLKDTQAAPKKPAASGM